MYEWHNKLPFKYVIKINGCLPLLKTETIDEFHISSWLNIILEIIMFIEIGLLKIGVKLPMGGSLLLLARKKK